MLESVCSYSMHHVEYNMGKYELIHFIKENEMNFKWNESTNCDDVKGSETQKNGHADVTGN